MSYITDNFKNWQPQLHKYSNGRIAIEYISETEGYPEEECRATVNLPYKHCEPDECFIKNYSENEGLLECMQSAGHVEPVIEYITTGFVKVPKVKCLLKP